MVGSTGTTRLQDPLGLGMVLLTQNFRSIGCVIAIAFIVFAKRYSKLPNKRGGPNKRGDGKNQQNQLTWMYLINVAMGKFLSNLSSIQNY